MMKHRPLTLTIIAVLTVPTAAHSSILNAEDFTLRAGAAGFYAPDYLGSDDYEVRALPDFELTYQDRAYLSARDGVGFYLLKDETTQFAAGIAPHWGRDEDDNAALTGLGDVDFGWDLRLLLQTKIDVFQIGIEGRQEISDGGGKTLVTGFTGFTQPIAPALLWTGKGSVSWANTEWTRDYFGVTAAQAAASGLPAFRADDGLRDASLSTGLIYSVTPNISLTGMVSYTRLLGDVADSPVTQDQNQVGGLLGLSYSWPGARQP